MVAADGSKANGEILGVRKRIVAAIAVSAALVVGIAAFFLGESNIRTFEQSNIRTFEHSNNSLSAPRHQIYGDPVLVKRFERGDFAQAWREASDTPCPLLPDDSREVRELKQIVNGMRQELRDYLSNGNGTPRSYWRRLNERTLQEVQIYERTRRELEKETSPTVWEQKNDALRRLGLRTIGRCSRKSEVVQGMVR